MTTKKPDFFGILLGLLIDPEAEIAKARRHIEETTPMTSATRTLDIDFADHVSTELAHARTKFPDSVCSLAALMEEVGELAQALLKVKAGKWPRERIWEEAVQVSVMAQRVAVEGDQSIEVTNYAEA